ncbi:lysozyme [Novosphingobium sp. NBM11]|nr:lysozyme [Novosphingobium sp. NBM11]
MEQPKGRKRLTLAAVVGTVTAGLLLTNIPKDESGRTVKVSIAENGEATVRHISGKQYLKAYLDIVGVATACDGLTSYKGRKITIRDQFSEEQCAVMLEDELVAHASDVMGCTPGLALTIPRRDNVRFAAVSLAYNIGTRSYCTSTGRRLVNEGKIGPACDAFTRFNRAGGRVVDGLVKRRARERAVCIKDAV